MKKGSKLRLSRPDERDQRRLEHPQTEWDVLHGLLMAFDKGDVTLARPYLNTHAGARKELILDLLEVWAAEVGDETLERKAKALLFGLGR